MNSDQQFRELQKVTGDIRHVLAADAVNILKNGDSIFINATWKWRMRDPSNFTISLMSWAQTFQTRKKLSFLNRLKLWLTNF